MVEEELAGHEEEWEIVKCPAYEQETAHLIVLHHHGYKACQSVQDMEAKKRRNVLLLKSLKPRFSRRINKARTAKYATTARVLANQIEALPSK